MPSRKGQSSDPSAVDMSLIEESAHRVLMQGIDSDGIATSDVMMQKHRSYWDDDGEETPTAAEPYHKTLDESRRTRGAHSKLESFGHWASTKVRVRGTLWFIHSGNNSPIGWPWVGTAFLLVFVPLVLLVLLCLFALDDAEIRSQQKRQDDMAFSYSTLISSRLMLMVSSVESVTGLVQGSMMASAPNRTGLETKNGTLLPHYDKYVAAALDRMLPDLPPSSSSSLRSAWVLSIPSAILTQTYPLTELTLGLNFLDSSWKSIMIETALTGKVGIITFVLKGLEYVGVVVPVYNESASQMQRDQRAANRAKYSKMSTEELLKEASPNISRFEDIEVPGFAPGMWGWITGFLQGRPFVNGTGLMEDMDATLGGLDMSWCLYSIDPYVYGGNMLVLGSSREGKSSSGLLDTAANVTVFFNRTGSLELDPRPGEYCTEMLDSVTSSRRGATKVVISAKVDRFRTAVPWVLLLRSNTNGNYLSSRNIAITVFTTMFEAAAAIILMYCILLYRRKSSDTPASAPKTTPFTFMSVRLLEGEMLWKCCPEAALDLVEKFGIIVREAARDHDLYDCQPDAPHSICFASRSVAPAVLAAEMFLERLSVLRYPMSVSMDMWDAEESSSRRAAERRVLVEELEKRATQISAWNAGGEDGSASPPGSFDIMKDVRSTNSQSRQYPTPTTKLLRPTQVRPFLVQVLVQRCDNGRVLYDVQSSRFKYNPAISSAVVDRLCATNMGTKEPHCMPNCIYLNEAAAKEARKTLTGAILKPDVPFMLEAPRVAVGSATSLDASASPLSPTAWCINLFTYANAIHNAALDQSRERARAQLANRAARNDTLYTNILTSYREARQAGWGEMQKVPFRSAPVRGDQPSKRVRKAAPKSAPIIKAQRSDSSDSAPINSESDEKRGDDLEPPPADVWGVSGTRSLQDASRHLNIPPHVDHTLRTVFDQYIPNFIEALQRSADLSKDLSRDIRQQQSDSGTGTSSLSAPNSVFTSSGERDEHELSQSTTPSESVSIADMSNDALYQRFRIRLFVYVNALQVMFSAYSPEERGQLLERLRSSFQVEIPQELVIHHLAAACCLANDLANLPLGKRHPAVPSEKETSPSTVDKSYHSPWGSEPASVSKAM